MDGERGPVERVSDVVGGIGDAWLFIFVLAIGLALVLTGNTLARLIGVGVLAVWLYFAVRLVQRLRAD